MGYVKPGVEITQVQKTVSPNLITPNLNAIVIGPGFYVGNFDALYPKYTGGSLSCLVSGLTDEMVLDQDTVYVDLVGRGGKLAGTVKHLSISDFTVTASGVTIDASLTGTYVKDPVLGTYETVAYDATNFAIPKIGFRALRGDMQKLITVETATNIESKIGEISTINPLAYGLFVALLNGNTQVYGYGTAADVNNAGLVYGSTSETEEHSNARDYLVTREVYAMAPLTTTASVLDAYKDHVNVCSAAINKHERIVFDNYTIPWADESDVLVNKKYLDGANNADAAGTARVLKQKALAMQERRVFYTFPDVVYVQETRHISTVSWDFMTSYYGFTEGAGSTNRLYAELDEQVTLSAVHPINPGKIYDLGTEITAEVLTDLSQVTEKSIYKMRVPLPGYYINAMVAGEVSGQLPQQGFTNLPTTGFFALKFSSDWFTEAQLNNIAEGGNYIMVQPSAASAIVCRHQLSTDMTSVERRELNITKTLDFVAKFIRNGISGYIGRYNITPAFLTMLTTTLNAQAIFLKRSGYVNDLKVLKVEQDPIQKDVVLVDLSVLPQYPVNYIKINLIF